MPSKSRPNLTVRFVNSLESRSDGKRLEVGDARAPGLYVCVTPTGVKSFCFSYRARGGPQRRLTLGKWPTTPEHQKEALDRFRADVRALSARVAMGEGPVGEARARAASEPESHSFEWLVTDYIENEAKPAIKTWAQAEGALRRLRFEMDCPSATIVAELKPFFQRQGWIQ